MIEISEADAACLRRLAAKYADAAWTDRYAHGGGISWDAGYSLVDELDRILNAARAGMPEAPVSDSR